MRGAHTSTSLRSETPSTSIRPAGLSSPATFAGRSFCASGRSAIFSQECSPSTGNPPTAATSRYSATFASSKPRLSWISSDTVLPRLTAWISSGSQSGSEPRKTTLTATGGPRADLKCHCFPRLHTRRHLSCLLNCNQRWNQHRCGAVGENLVKTVCCWLCATEALSANQGFRAFWMTP